MDTYRARTQLRAIVLTLLRITVGVIMMAHGWQKLTALHETQAAFAGMGIPYPEVSAYLAVCGELLGGLGILLGLLTPFAALGIICVMLVAVFHVHWDNDLMAQNNGFEYPLMILTVAIYFAVRGAGPYSLDALLARRRLGWGRRPIPGQHPLQTAP